MLVNKHFNAKNLFEFTGHHFIWLTIWMTSVTIGYQYTGLEKYEIPWLPLSIIATAVAFYVGFKNNSAYDRMWEARKIWGAIVNSSRAWGSAVKSFVDSNYSNEDITEEQLFQIKKKLIYRHIGWLYALRSQLLIITPWEHASQGFLVSSKAKRYKELFGLGLVKDEITETELHLFLPEEEYERMINYKNTATQIIDQQSQDLAELRSKNLINDFRHIKLQEILNDFYDHQGKCERIKKFPLPRQYGSIGAIFVGIFIFLLPFGMVSEFAKLGEYGIWASIPFTVLVGWIYIVMEIVGDYTENPFEGLANDVPMLSLCRVIENDLREMLGETKIPEDIKVKNGVLM
ncbi:bestrophin family protein [Chondrinema litorale]|uniref:bestrophin family protein n=1 Tax=Chondrinema litorale TaxID=2994555 RepID=UPI002542CAA3|nr:bestrophin family ion channel [Chondrinema litorale]UZR97407.1 bestrophin family ion channel [Chondrinema litorale]